MKFKDTSNKQKNNLKRDQNADTDSSDLDQEPIVSKPKKSKDASNKQNSNLKSYPKSYIDSSDSDYKSVVSKPTNMVDASSKKINKLKREGRYHFSVRQKAKNKQSCISAQNITTPG